MIKGDSGEYESSDAIPKGNYALNEEKTICENNGKVLKYDSSTWKVSFSFIGSDRCSLYFDKIIDTEKPVISNLTVNDTTITATLTDNTELSSYGISSSNSVEPTNWTSINGVSYNFSTTISTEGTYYLWVKDTSGNITKKEFMISLGTPITTLLSTSTPDVYNENGLRYEGADPNNYVCLDNQKSGSCSSSSLLFRIIGLFDEDTSNDDTNSSGIKKVLKIIDTNNYGGTSWKVWNSSYLNKWSSASLKTELNGTYLTTLLGISNVNSKLSSAIATAKWHLGGVNNITNSIYNYEVITTENWYKAERAPYYTATNLSQNLHQNLYSGNPEFVYAKVGLMYPSDYGYATIGGSTTNRSSCIAVPLYKWNCPYSDCYKNNWIFNSKKSFINYKEWLISPTGYDRSSSSTISYDGSVHGESYSTNDSGTAGTVRPVIYLDSSLLKIVGGTGTSTDPYHIG